MAHIQWNISPHCKVFSSSCGVKQISCSSLLPQPHLCSKEQNNMFQNHFYKRLLQCLGVHFSPVMCGRRAESLQPLQLTYSHLYCKNYCWHIRNISSCTFRVKLTFNAELLIFSRTTCLGITREFWKESNSFFCFYIILCLYLIQKHNAIPLPLHFDNHQFSSVVITARSFSCG